MQPDCYPGRKISSTFKILPLLARVEMVDCEIDKTMQIGKDQSSSMTMAPFEASSTTIRSLLSAVVPLVPLAILGRFGRGES